MNKTLDFRRLIRRLNEREIVHSVDYVKHRLNATDPVFQDAVAILAECTEYLKYTDHTFTMDVVWDRTAQKHKILGFNSFWSAGIYGNSVDAVLDAITQTKGEL